MRPSYLALLTAAFLFAAFGCSGELGSPDEHDRSGDGGTGIGGTGHGGADHGGAGHGGTGDGGTGDGGTGDGGTGDGGTGDGGTGDGGTGAGGTGDGGTGTGGTGTGGTGSGGKGGSGAVPRIGPRPVASTPASKGTLFAAPNGSGSSCTQSSPCPIRTAVSNAQAGDVVFLRGGTYALTSALDFSRSGSKNSPITFESFPGELAVLSGEGVSVGNDVRLRINGNFIALRKLEVRSFPVQGIWIGGNDNLFEGLHVHHNKLSGIQIYSNYDDFPYGNHGSRNIIRDSIVNDNSGAGLGGAEYDDGGNSDGISISSGEGNRVERCLAYKNSDDGIDTWRATNTYVGYSIAWGNGIASGNGQGFKMGGAPPSRGATVEHSISYQNKRNGFVYNGAKEDKFFFNTSWDNNNSGFQLGSDNVARGNISAADGNAVEGSGTQENNSWQRGGSPSFLSTDPSSPDFLVPTPGGGFEDIGAYATP